MCPNEPSTDRASASLGTTPSNAGETPGTTTAPRAGRDPQQDYTVLHTAVESNNFDGSYGVLSLLLMDRGVNVSIPSN